MHREEQHNGRAAKDLLTSNMAKAFLKFLFEFDFLEQGLVENGAGVRRHLLAFFELDLRNSVDTGVNF